MSTAVEYPGIARTMASSQRWTQILPWQMVHHGSQLMTGTINFSPFRFRNDIAAGHKRAPAVAAASRARTTPARRFPPRGERFQHYCWVQWLRRRGAQLPAILRALPAAWQATLQPETVTVSGRSSLHGVCRRLRVARVGPAEWSAMAVPGPDLPRPDLPRPALPRGVPTCRDLRSGRLPCPDRSAICLDPT